MNGSTHHNARLSEVSITYANITNSKENTVYYITPVIPTIGPSLAWTKPYQRPYLTTLIIDYTQAGPASYSMLPIFSFPAKMAEKTAKSSILTQKIQTMQEMCLQQSSIIKIQTALPMYVHPVKKEKKTQFESHLYSGPHVFPRNTQLMSTVNQHFNDAPLNKG